MTKIVFGGINYGTGQGHSARLVEKLAEAKKGKVMEAKEERMKKLYEVVEKSEGTPVPKRAFLSWKCPKCGSKLSKKSAKDIIYMGEDASEFAKKVTAKAGVLQGVYNLAINHFTCQKCGYEFAQAEVEEMSD